MLEKDVLRMIGCMAETGLFSNAARKGKDDSFTSFRDPLIGVDEESRTLIIQSKDGNDEFLVPFSDVKRSCRVKARPGTLHAFRLNCENYRVYLSYGVVPEGMNNLANEDVLDYTKGPNYQAD